MTPNDEKSTYPFVNPAEINPAEIDPTEIDCAQTCVNGCVLGEQCPNREYQAQASRFIQETSLDQMLAIADEAFRKKMTTPPQWVYPEDL